MAAITARTVILASTPQGIPQPKNFKIEERPALVDQLSDGHILVQTLLLSVDPYLRLKMGRMEGGRRLLPVKDMFKENEPLSGYGVGRVIESKSMRFKTGKSVSVTT